MVGINWRIGVHAERLYKSNLLTVYKPTIINKIGFKMINM